jgi:AraC-like DNA-binding protein
VTSSPPLPVVAVAGSGVVSVVDYVAGSSYGPRRLVDYEFVWLLSGSAVWTVHSSGLGCPQPPAPLTLRPGTLLLAPTGAVDSFAWDSHQPTRHAWAHFRVVDAAQLPDPATWPLVRSMAAAPVLTAACTYLLELAALSSVEARQRSDQFLGLLLDLFVRGPLEAPPPALPPLLAATLESVRRLWLADGVRLIEIHELVADVSVSAAHLHRIFRQHWGCGPVRALELVRLSRAAVMLQRSNATLEQVAQAAGFANAYHLSRRFRSAYGVPPGAYRRHHATADPLAPVRAAGLLSLAQALSGA